MPDDLLHHLIAPEPYASVWLWPAAAAAAALIAWYMAIFILTSPRRQHRAPHLLGTARSEMLKRRSLHAIGSIEKRYRTGALAAPSAAAALGRELRGYLQEVTGVRVRYLHVGAITSGSLAPAGPILAEIVDIQFNQHSRTDVSATCAAAEELVRRWT